MQDFFLQKSAKFLKHLQIFKMVENNNFVSQNEFLVFQNLKQDENNYYTQCTEAS